MDESAPGVLTVAGVSLRPLVEENREALRRAAAEDGEIWEIYSYSLLGEGFDRWWAERAAADALWRMFTVHWRGELAGMTGYAPDRRHPGVVEVGASYLVPRLRGGGLNRVVKWLILSHLFGRGAHRVEFRIDARNGRSRAAALKLGAVEEGVLRHHKITHTGFIRDTHIYAITDADWKRIGPGLQPATPPAAGGSSS